MRLAITGAGGNIGRGIAPALLDAGHELVLSDLPGVEGLDPRAELRSADVRVPGALDGVVDGAELLLHLPAWHGIHVAGHSEREFWELNVDGTYQALQSAVTGAVPRVVWLSSQSIHDAWGRYGFTKVLGEQLLEYHRRMHGLSTVAVRPGNLTPWTDFAGDYGRGLLTGRVDRADVLDAVQRSIEWLAANEGALVVDATQPDSIPDDAIAAWAADPVGTAERVFPGAAAVIERFGLDVSTVPHRPRTSGWAEIGYAPTRDFGAWVREVESLSDDEVGARTSSY